MKAYRWDYSVWAVHRTTYEQHLVSGQVMTDYHHSEAARHEVRRLFQGTEYLTRGVTVTLVDPA